MKHLNFSFLALATLLIFGCKAQTSAEEKVTAPAAQIPSVALSAEQLLGQKLRKEMSYAELRKTVQAEGWLPLVTPDCKENVGGEALICDTQPELESCSGDGHCNMQFLDAAMTSKLRVGTYDEAVKFFEFSSLAGAPKSVSCPSQNFEKFLQEFSSNKAVKNAFTSPFLKVMEMIDLEGTGYVERQVYIAKSDYKNFDLQYMKDGFHVIDSDGKADETPTPLEIKPQDPGSYFVKYFYGMSEGNSYAFKKKSDCWYLTEDPEAPAP